MKENAAGFTLMELLIVVIIVGILSAISLPWYYKAVEKARAVEAKEILDTVYKAEEMYYMMTGNYATYFSELDVDIPWPSVPKWAEWFGEAKGNGRWVINIEKGTNSNVSIMIGRPSGQYEGAGFLYQMICTNYPDIPRHELLCIEMKDKFKQTAGTYCQQMMGGTLVTGNTGSYRVYRLSR